MTDHTSPEQATPDPTTPDDRRHLIRGFTHMSVVT